MQVRLAELLIALSGVGDLGRERRTGAAARSCFIASRLARAMGLADAGIQDVFYTALLQHVGCVGYAQETAAIFAGRDTEMNHAGSHTDFADPADFFRTFIPELTAGTDLPTKVRLLAAALTKAPKLGPVIHRASCEIASCTAQRIGLAPGVVEALHTVEEWYDGHGGFQGLSGADIPLTARVVLTGMTAMTFHELSGAIAALQVVAQRSGKQLDPAVAAAFAVHGHDILDALDAADVEAELFAEEPPPFVLVDEDQLDEVALAFGQIVDLKNPTSYGNSRAAFDIAGQAAKVMSIDSGPVRRAAALRDIGKAAVSNGILGKGSALTRSEQEEYDLHPLHTHRVLARSQTLAAEAELSAVHHEREDGSGTFKGLRGENIPAGGKLLAAVDAYLEMTHPRLGEPVTPQQGCEQLSRLAQQGALNPVAVRAVVVAVTGAKAHLCRELPARLTERQVEVLRRLANGDSNKQIAAALVVSPRTAEHHVQDIYRKIGVSSRAAAALFTVQHGLL